MGVERTRLARVEEAVDEVAAEVAEAAVRAAGVVEEGEVVVGVERGEEGGGRGGAVFMEVEVAAGGAAVAGSDAEGVAAVAFVFCGGVDLDEGVVWVGEMVVESLGW